jgi:transposase
VFPILWSYYNTIFEAVLSINKPWYIKDIEFFDPDKKRIRESFQDIYQAETEDAFSLLLNKWYFWATHSRLESIIKVAKTIRAHWDGILEWKRSHINNGILEGLNSIVQAAKAKAGGFSTFKNFRIIIFLTNGNLKFNLVNEYAG